MYLSHLKVLVPLFVGAALVAGCQEAEPPQKAEVSRPVPILEIPATELNSALRFPGRVQAEQRAQLAFNVPGRIIEFPVQEGEILDAGSLIARHDPASFEAPLSAARAEFDKARADYARVKKIWEQSQAVARAEAD